MVRQQGAELWMKGIPHTTQDGVGIAPWKPQGKNKTANEEGHWAVYNKSDVSPEKEWIGVGVEGKHGERREGELWSVCKNTWTVLWKKKSGVSYDTKWEKVWLQ